jgi:hypothetical protein
MSSEGRRLSKREKKKVRRDLERLWCDTTRAHCSLCGKRGATVHHYLEKAEDGESFLAPHPLAPILCDKCAHHGRVACVVWHGATCVVSEAVLVTNASLY